jgi:predicted transcriptional regulator
MEYYNVLTRREVSVLARVSKVLSFSLPPDTASKIENLAKSENRSRSELLREMVNVYERYQAEAEWQELFIFGEETAKRFKIKNEAELFKILGGAA